MLTVQNKNEITARLSYWYPFFAIKDFWETFDAVLAEQARVAEQPTEDEQELEQVLKDRDDMEERLTILAESVGHYFDVPVGEWSNCNSPDQEALKILNGEYKTKFEKPSQPPAGDAQIVERMLIAYHGCKPHPNNKIEQHMAAALAVAREGWVSLDDVEKAIDAEDDNYCAWVRIKKQDERGNQLQLCDSDSEGAFKVWRLSGIKRMLKPLLARLAKPAEQTPEQKVEAILTAEACGGGNVTGYYKRCAQKIVAALKAGKK